MPKNNLPPMRLLKSLQKAGVWRLVDHMREGKGNGLPDWPDWCYMPIAGGAAVSSTFGPQALCDNLLSPAVITAAAAWRVSKGVYRYDADLYNLALNAPRNSYKPS